MKRADWLRKVGHATETIHVRASGVIALDSEPFYVLIHDAEGREADGFGATEEFAFGAALVSYKKARHRAGLTTARASA